MIELLSRLGYRCSILIRSRCSGPAEVLVLPSLAWFLCESGGPSDPFLGVQEARPSTGQIKKRIPPSTALGLARPLCGVMGPLSP